MSEWLWPVLFLAAFIVLMRSQDGLIVQKTHSRATEKPGDPIASVKSPNPVLLFATDRTPVNKAFSKEF